MAYHHHQRLRDPSALDPRLSSQDTDGTILSLIVVFAIAAIVFASFYLFPSPTLTRLADTSVSFEAMPPVDPTARPIPRAVQRETRPTQAPIR